MSRGTKTTEFLKECMADALIKLIQEKSIEQISIADITLTSGVSRSTWFRNFQTKSEALTYKLVKLWERWAADNGLNSRERFKLKNALDFFKFNYNIRELLNIICDAGQKSCIYDAFCEVMKPQYNASVLESYQSRFYAHGLFGILEEWINGGFRESPEEMFELFYAVMDDRSTL